MEKILKHLNDMQSEVSSLKTASSSSSLPTPHQKHSLYCEQSGDEYSTDQDSFHESASFSSKKRDRSPSPHEEVDDDPSYRETLAAISTLLEVKVPEESADQSTKIFGSHSGDLNRKATLLMVMPLLEGVVDRWNFYVAKATV